MEYRSSSEASQSLNALAPTEEEWPNNHPRSDTSMFLHHPNLSGISQVIHAKDEEALA
ncbi:MAG: hypothetical protein GKR87_07655 [Kiritimatiellae bacterium]|nr:hypothetical protein [Kiritimatiellia bacterium]